MGRTSDKMKNVHTQAGSKKALVTYIKTVYPNYEIKLIRKNLPHYDVTLVKKPKPKKKTKKRKR